MLGHTSTRPHQAAKGVLSLSDADREDLQHLKEHTNGGWNTPNHLSKWRALFKLPAQEIACLLGRDIGGESGTTQESCPRIRLLPNVTSTEHRLLLTIRQDRTNILTATLQWPHLNKQPFKLITMTTGASLGDEAAKLTRLFLRNLVVLGQKLDMSRLQLGKDFPAPSFLVAVQSGFAPDETLWQRGGSVAAAQQLHRLGVRETADFNVNPLAFCHILQLYQLPGFALQGMGLLQAGVNLKTISSKQANMLQQQLGLHHDGQSGIWSIAAPAPAPSPIQAGPAVDVVNQPA